MACRRQTPASIRQGRPRRAANCWLARWLWRAASGLGRGRSRASVRRISPADIPGAYSGSGVVTLRSGSRNRRLVPCEENVITYRFVNTTSSEALNHTAALKGIFDRNRARHHASRIRRHRRAVGRGGDARHAGQAPATKGPVGAPALRGVLRRAACGSPPGSCSGSLCGVGYGGRQAWGVCR